ncbi:hypothetical protein BV25DRAFT_1911482 [Artomyces pyxidatus]|uniref:Uncharacterized protein n=1 Tax=Artomyces pyxidatus TaxID=48021 RepID=A0ACB8TGR2_9AGAM|nr:hypothetical protein BV25DRAFT_1911482 [Artomyces pyxidatus]
MAAVVSPPIASFRTPSSATEFWSTAARDRLASIRGNAFVRDQYTAARLQRSLQEELMAIQSVVCTVSAELNSLSPISRLPPETMSHILSYVAAIDRPDLELKPEKFALAHRQRLGWIKATHVCRRWRHIALNFTDLWRRVILVFGAEWAEEMVARAKSAPLCFTLDHRWRTVRESTGPVISDHLQRTQSVSVLHGGSSSAGYWLRYLAKCLFHKPAPFLESVEFGDPDERVHWDMESNFFNDSAPRLRSVVLRGCTSFAWHSPILRHLTSLTIEDCTQRLSFDDFVTLLQQMKAIKVLVLKHCLPNVEDTSSSSPSAVVDLTQLTDFTLNGVLSIVVRLLTHLRIAGTTRLSITSHSGQNFDYPMFVTVLQGTGFLDKGLPFTHVQHPTVSYGACLYAWRAPHASASSSPHDPADLMLHFSSGGNRIVERTAVALLKAIHPRAIPGQDLVHLEVRSYRDGWTAQTWLDLFGHSPNMRRVEIAGRPIATAFVTALSHRSGDAETGCQSFFMPSLTSLELTFSIYPSIPADCEFYERLLAAMESRKQDGVVLSQISAAWSDFPEARLARLREFVPLVEHL